MTALCPLTSWMTLFDRNASLILEEFVLKRLVVIICEDFDGLYGRVAARFVDLNLVMLI